MKTNTNKYFTADKDSGFPESRYKHCYNVGKKMYTYAKEKWHWGEKKCNEMFVLGNLHDIGYALDSDAFGHDRVLADTLEGTYKYSNEIRYHSYLQHNYDSPEMRLIYFGDMTVDGQGNWCTFKERLADLEKRYGLNSEVYKESLAIVNHLIKLGFDDSL